MLLFGNTPKGRKRLFAHNFLKSGGRFECGDIMCGNHYRYIASDIAGLLLGTGLDDERTEATEINILTIGQRVFNYFHERFYYFKHCGTIDTGGFCDLKNDFSFCHFD